MVNFDYNKVILAGVPMKVSSLKRTAKGEAVYNVILECEDNAKCAQIPVTVWGDLAIKTYDRVCRAKRIFVEGRLNNTRDSFEVTVARIFCAE